MNKTLTFGVFFALAFVLCTADSEAEAMGSARKRLTINDLPVELRLIIFEDFDFTELVAVAKLHPLHRRVAEIFFNQKYGNEKLLINIKGLTVRYADISIFYKNDKQIGDIFAAYSALELFGNSIRYLEIDYEKFNDFECSVINELVSRCLANSLIQIELSYFNDEKLNGLTGPFNKVEVVRFSNIFKRSNDFNFRKIFPMIRSFDTNNLKYLSLAAIEHHFPNLEEIKENGFITIPQLERIFKLNPQIQELEVQSRDLDRLKRLSEQLSQLKRFELTTLAINNHLEGDDIEFEQLTSFLTDIHEVPSNLGRIPIVFGNLKEIRCNVRIDKWFDVIIRNKNLKKIISSEFSNGQLQQVVEQLINLEELWVKYNANTYDVIVRFFEASENLKRIGFYDSSLLDCNKIRERFQNRWEVSKGLFGYHTIFTKIQ